MGSSFGREYGGTTPGMTWYTLDNGASGVFKPWSSRQFEAETTYKELADFFGLEVSPCVRTDDGGFVSIRSYNPRYTQVHFYDIDSAFGLKEVSEIVCSEIVEKLKLVMFVDAVCNNTDRHNGNLALLRSIDGNFVDLCPPYDNCSTFELSFGRNALFGVDAKKAWRHKEVLKWLERNWSGFNAVFNKYISPEFLQCVYKSAYFDWILEQQSYLLGL